MGIRPAVGVLVVLLATLGCSSREQRSEKAYQRGTAALDRKDYDTAIAEFTESIRLDREASGAYQNRGLAYHHKKEYATAGADYTEAMRLDPNDSDAHSNLAWLLATCPKAEFRDGKRAVELATRACKLSDWKDANHMENLAAAYAEVSTEPSENCSLTRAVAASGGIARARAGATRRTTAAPWSTARAPERRSSHCQSGAVATQPRTPAST